MPWEWYNRVMKLTDFFSEQLKREGERTRGALTNLPEGKDNWAPHAKSMPLLRLAGLVATIPSWFALIVNQDSLELSPPEGQGQYKQPTVAELVGTLDKGVKEGRAAIDGTTDDYLLTTKWKLLVKGQVVMEQPRHIVVFETFNHLAHHRGQLTVYLRLLDRPVPAIYGPSADDQHFA
jgi:uncharacterized damage-inducible protein DinB